MGKALSFCSSETGAESSDKKNQRNKKQNGMTADVTSNENWQRIHFSDENTTNGPLAVMYGSQRVIQWSGRVEIHW